MNQQIPQGPTSAERARALSAAKSAATATRAYGETDRSGRMRYTDNLIAIISGPSGPESAPRARVDLMTEPMPICALRTSDGRVAVFRPGIWTSYVAELGRCAEAELAAPRESARPTA